MKIKNLILPFVILCISLFSGCTDDDFEEVIGLCPVVTSTNPLDGAINVPLDQTITVLFNKEMNPTTFTQSSFIIEEAGSVVIAGNVSLSGATASFNPTNALLINTTYVGTVKTLVKDMDGNALQEDYVFTFSTGSTVTPVVASTDPMDLATNVFLNKTVAANFNMLMNHSTINTSTFTLRQGTTEVLGVVSYSGQTALFNPTNNLLDATEYTATITTGARNVQGTALVSDYTWTFTTGAVAGPTVISTDPMNNASGVALDKVITAVFSEAMDNTTINNTSFTLKNGSTVITGALSYSGTTLTFIPGSPLLEGTTYTGTITVDAQSLSGVALANDYIWNFNTLSTNETMVDLQSVARFGIIAGVAVSNNAGFSEIRNMDVGIYPGVRSSLTGFPPAIVVNGAIFASDDTAPAGVPAMLLQAKDDLTAAYLFAEGASSPAPATVSGDQGGTTLAPGIYKTTSTLLIESGDLTLDAQGDPNATWIFQIASDFTTVGGAGGNVILAGGAKAKNVFWQVGSSATLGDYTDFKGNILALTSITMNSYSTAEGRMLARNGAVIMTHTNIITKPID